MKFKIILFLLCVLFFSLNSCEKDNLLNESSVSQFDKESFNKLSNQSLLNSWKDNPYKLNVIYFVPNDIDTIPNYRKRLSNILLKLQKFYGSNLQRAGYGNKSFGLDLLSDTSVNIITINGTKGNSAYPYDGGGDAILTEVNQFFSQNPTVKKSDHILIITPSYNLSATNPGGPPFYGLGKNCFALDYPGMDIDKLGVGGTAGYLASKWIGGLAHELGHGLNAPHNVEHKTDKPNLGTALMGGGNTTYGKNPTFITNAMAGLLSTSQTFSTVTRTNWYNPVQNTLIKLKGELVNNKIVISGKFTSNIPVKVINVFHDRLPATADTDYDALAWNTHPTSSGTFSIECPLADFYNLSEEYELRVEFYHENGTLVSYKYLYSFVNSIPNISVINTKDLFDTSTWQVLSTDSEEAADGKGSYIIDGNNNTWWHTKWREGEASLPHQFIVDMKSVRSVKGFAFTNREDLNGAIKNIEIFKSNNNSTWTSVGTYTLKAQQGIQYIELPQTYSMRYVKVKVTSTNGNYQYTHLAEFTAF